MNEIVLEMPILLSARWKSKRVELLVMVRRSIIARYRKKRPGELNEIQMREIADTLDY